MNYFRFSGDMTHLLAITMLLWRIWNTNSVAGISGKSQILFAVVFTTRYLDLVTSFISIYNTVMKLFFIASSYVTVYLIYRHLKATNDSEQDTFRVEYLVLSAGWLAIHVNYAYFMDIKEILWTFSIYLESVAILPQLGMGWKTGTEPIIILYLFAMFSYRTLYLLNWIYRYYTEGYFDRIAFVAGCIQTLCYLIYWVLKALKGGEMSSGMTFAVKTFRSLFPATIDMKENILVNKNSNKITDCSSVATHPIKEPGEKNTKHEFLKTQGPVFNSSFDG